MPLGSYFIDCRPIRASFFGVGKSNNVFVKPTWLHCYNKIIALSLTRYCVKGEHKPHNNYFKFDMFCYIQNDLGS